MTDFVKILCHARRLKSATKTLSVADLKEVKTKLEKIIKDRKVEEEEAKKLEAKKLAKIQEYRKMMTAEGIDPAELIVDEKKTPAKRAPRPPKYQIKNAAGELITWTGQGRMPNVFKAKVKAGDSMDKFLIKK